MKVEGLIFGVLAVFLVIVTPVYWFMSKDPTGTSALVLTFGLAILVTFYAFITARRIQPRPEDQKDAEIQEGAGEIGFFSPHSWWPLFVALSAAGICVGLVFGWWLVILSVACLIMTTVGFVFEYYRGQFAH
jgi:hypothetical protein